VLLLLGVSICTFWHSVLSLSLICVCHLQISPLFPFAKIPISGSGSVYLSLTHTDIHTQDPTKYRRTQQQRQTLLLGVPISTFWHSFLSLSLCVYHWRFSPLYLFAKIPISCSCSVSLTYIGDCKVIAQITEESINNNLDSVCLLFSLIHRSYCATSVCLEVLTLSTKAGGWVSKMQLTAAGVGLKRLRAAAASTFVLRRSKIKLSERVIHLIRPELEVTRSS
jgi:hypothetical protein